MRIYVLCGEDDDCCLEMYLRFYKHKEDAKWGLNKLLCNEDEEYCSEEYIRYTIHEIEVVERWVRLLGHLRKSAIQRTTSHTQP